MSQRPDRRLLVGRDVVVIGASAGGVEALQRLAGILPADLGAAVFVVLHVPPTSSVLPDILSRSGRLPADHARDEAPIEGGRIVIAPPDYHLLLGETHVRLVRGPKENGHRPAVDPLFRSAAERHGRRVVGVILSGSRDDGTAGLGLVKRAGGLTIVQDPKEALYRGMPSSAIAHTDPDLVLTVAEIGALIGSLEPPPAEGAQSREAEDVDDDASLLHPEELTAQNEARGRVSRYTCPECSGTLWEIRDGDVAKLRCRVGHKYTEESFLIEHAAKLEAALWTAVMTLEERADFYRELAERSERYGQSFGARRYREQAESALEQVDQVRSALLNLPGPLTVDEDEEERTA